MTIKEHYTVRTTTVVLTNEEFTQAIREYLTKAGVRDTTEHLIVIPVITNDDRGIMLKVEITNSRL